MSDDAEDMVAFRLAPRDRDAIRRLVDKGEFRNRSDFLRYAVKLALRDLAPDAPAPMDLDFEGVSLPAPAPPRPHHAGQRGRKGVNL